MSESGGKGRCLNTISVFISTRPKELDMAKSKQANKITQDNDGTYFCLKCGQAGFETKPKAYGHLTHCKGYKSAINKVQKEIQERQKYLAYEDAGDSEASKNKLDVDYESASSSFIEKNIESGPPEGHPRATLRATLRASGHPEKNRVDDSDELKRLKLENMILRKDKQNLEKIAYNHNQHYPQARQNFSGPQDMVNSAFGGLMENNLVKIIVTLGALAVLLNFVTDQFDKLDKKSKNIRK